MENIYFSQKIKHQLPEWLLYQLWYILSDYDCFCGERQQCLRIVQNEPPEELVMSFLAEQPVSACIVIRRQGERVVMMLAEEDDTEPIDSSTAVTEIGGTKYASLPEAFAAASNYDDTITLLNNTELAEPLSVSLNDHYISHFTLDLKGKTISCNNGNSDTLFVCATLIICDSSSKKLEESRKTPCRPVRAGRKTESRHSVAAMPGTGEGI